MKVTSNILLKLAKKISKQKIKATRDLWVADTWDDLVVECAESLNATDWDGAFATQSVKRSAEKFENIILSSSVEFAETNNITIQNEDKWHDEAAWIAFRTLEGSGRQITDGDWDKVWGKENTKKLRDHWKRDGKVKKAMSELESRIYDAVYETCKFKDEGVDEAGPQTFPQQDLSINHKE